MELWVEITGYLASLFVATSFYMKTIIPLRLFAICSNVAFITYGYFGNLYPVLILHLFLFPLNIYRLFQMKRLIDDVRDAHHGDMSMDALIPFMTKHEYNKGDFLFKKNDKADVLFYILKGEVNLPEINVTVHKNDIIGEMGIFSPFKERTCSAVCKEDSIIYTINEEKIKQLYYQNPAFGFHLIQLIIKRFIMNNQG